MVIYIEACESGSMFENKLPDNVNSKCSLVVGKSDSCDLISVSDLIKELEMCRTSNILQVI